MQGRGVRGFQTARRVKGGTPGSHTKPFLLHALQLFGCPFPPILVFATVQLLPHFFSCRLGDFPWPPPRSHCVYNRSTVLPCLSRCLTSVQLSPPLPPYGLQAADQDDARRREVDVQRRDQAVKASRVQLEQMQQRQVRVVGGERGQVGTLWRLRAGEPRAAGADAAATGLRSRGREGNTGCNTAEDRSILALTV